MDRTKDKTIFRYNLNDDIREIVTHFSKLHMYSSREVFKEKWKEWLIKNSIEIEKEKERLKILGYKKNVDDKIYTAARYYFKKKPEKPEKPEKVDNKDKPLKTNPRVYIVLDDELVKQMDLYIKENYDRDFKPSTSYIEFIELNKELVNKEIERLINIKVESLNTLYKCKEKIKKTYKNRCYINENK
tara:strand:+ start:1946 stop:2506 length:561 start_codon:yes stop_codon:yes gene_type:complete